MAGTWYPDRPEELSKIIDGYLNQVRPVDGTPLALIVPHAGYRYSGLVAAHAFKQLEGRKVDTAVVIASDHQPPISRPISVWAEGGYETPYGVITVQERLAERLLDHDPRIRFDPDTHASEHPLEIELPFLQRVCPDCRILPIMIGRADDETEDVLAEALIEILPDENVVIIASSDLSHYPSYEDAVQVDEATISAIELGDPPRLRGTIRENMNRGIPNLATGACGEAPIRIAMRVAEVRGADAITRLRYANSGDVEHGDRARVVGYAAIMFWHYEPPDLSAQHRTRLIKLATEAVDRFVVGGEVLEETISDPILERLSAVFVTLRVGGEMRGCIGQVRADMPLYQAVREKAIAAATGDPRFATIAESELDDLSCEISILSPLERIEFESELEVGSHGVAIRRGNSRAVLLPKVATDRNWTREMLLNNLFAKAGLPAEARNDATGLYRFTTLEIEEG